MSGYPGPSIMLSFSREGVAIDLLTIDGWKRDYIGVGGSYIMGDEDAEFPYEIILNVPSRVKPND